MPDPVSIAADSMRSSDNEATLETAERRAELAAQAGFFEGYMACLRCLLKAYGEGRLNDEWARDVRGSLSLHEEHD